MMALARPRSDLAILGGAVGWGLKRNVLDCYKFICRNSQVSNADARFIAGLEDAASWPRRDSYRVTQQGFKHPGKIVREQWS
jgi:hypothetical protein